MTEKVKTKKYLKEKEAKLKLLRMLEEGFHMGKIKIKHRSELYNTK